LLPSKSSERGRICLHGHLLDQGRLEVVVDEDDSVDLRLRVELGHAMRDPPGRPRNGGWSVKPVNSAGELEPPEAERADPAPPDPDPADLLALPAERALEGPGRRAGESAS